MIRNPRARRLLCGLVGLACLSEAGGCQAWYPDREFLRPETVENRDLRLVLADRSIVELRHARVQGDSLIGSEPQADSSPARRTVLVSDVRYAEVRRVDVAQTASYTVAALAAVGLVLALRNAGSFDIMRDW